MGNVLAMELIMEQYGGDMREFVRISRIRGSGEAKTIGKERARNVSLKYKKCKCKEALGIIAT